MPPETIQVRNSDGDITVRIDGDTVTLTAGIPGATAVIELMSPLEAEQRRIAINAEGEIHAGGSQSGGVFAAYHRDAEHGAVDGATARLDAAGGRLDLARFVSGSGATSTIRLIGEEASARLGASGSPGTAAFVDAEGEVRIDMEAQNARILLRGPVEGAPGTVTADPTHGPVVIEISGDTSSIRIGNVDHPGSILVRDAAGREAIELGGANAEISIGVDGRFGVLTVRNRDGENRIVLNGQSGRVTGESGRFRDVLTIDAGGRTTMQMDGNDAALRVGTSNRAGRIEVRSSTGQDTIAFHGESGEAVLGGEGEAGALLVRSANGQNAIVLNGATAAMSLGRSGEAGNVLVRAANGENAIVLNGETAALSLGRNGDAGNVFVKNDAGNDTFVVNGATAAAALGRSGRPGDLFVKNDAGENAIHLRGAAGEIRLGTNGTAGDIVLENDAGRNTIHLNGQTGDIVLMNGDCAEEFEIDELQAAPPGTLLAIEADGRLRPCRRAYDRRVAGVVSGGGPYRPGIVLNRTESSEPRAAVALIGRVMCKVDAGYGAIETGDLLTTSETSGHAMKVRDFARAPGAIVGKALQGWHDGRGLIPILVTLQ